MHYIHTYVNRKHQIEPEQTEYWKSFLYNIKRYMRINTILILSFAMLFFALPIFAQGKIGIKTNLLYGVGTLTPNLGAEVGLSPHWGIDISVGYNPWTFSGNKKMKHLFIRPEVRYWLCERFNGHFFGVHLSGGSFNIGGIPFPGMNDKFRYEGYAAGAGLTYGYQWMIGRRWNLEASLGLGYMYARYDKFECAACGKKLEANHTKDFFTPTRAGISVIYLIK